MTLAAEAAAVILSTTEATQEVCDSDFSVVQFFMCCRGV
jgi:hypothetical protein